MKCEVRGRAGRAGRDGGRGREGMVIVMVMAVERDGGKEGGQRLHKLELARAAIRYDTPC